MLHTKLNRPTLSKNLLRRPQLIEKLDKNSHLPLILIVAPAGYGKSILVSQWVEKKSCKCCWLSLEKSMSESSTFLTYFTEMLERCSANASSKLKRLNLEYHILSWEAIIHIIINELNKLKEPSKLVLDDYHLIDNPDIHKLIDAIISENIKNLQLVIITRKDPPLQLRELRLYQKILELRMRDLRFEAHEITQFLVIGDHPRLNESEIKMLFHKTEGWILAIRMELLAKSYPHVEGKKGGAEINENNLDRLMDQISQNIDPTFFRQMQLCALCDEFNADLIDSICAYAFPDSCKAGVFLSKLKDLNFFLIPTESEGTWFRFHHLVGGILKRHLKKSEPNSIIPLYNHISAWFYAKGLVDEAIHYAIKAENYALACEQITMQRASILDQGQWWVLQRWLDKIPRQIRNTNVDILLMELLVCEETWGPEDFSSILDALKSVGIENSSDENISLYLFHLGYFLTFFKPDPKKAVELLERSEALRYDESYMFGGRRELILACSRQMLGSAVLALQSLEEIQEKFDTSAKIHVRSIHGKVLVHLLSGNFESANNDIKKLLFLVQGSDLHYAKGWGSYFQGNVAFQSYNEYEVMHALKEALAFEGMFNYRVYFDALAGLILISSLKKDEKSTASFLEQMSQLATNLKDKKFELYYESVRARVNWHRMEGHKELDWAQRDWVKQPVAAYFFLIDVPDFTKLRIIASYGSVIQVKELINVLTQLETALNKIHNCYHILDIKFLKIIALFRLGSKKQAEALFEKTLLLVEKNEMTRPLLEMHLAMPSVFNGIKISENAQRLLTRFGFNTLKVEKSIHTKSDELSIREQQVVGLIAKGLRNKEIADQLHISMSTVKSHLTNIFRKLDVSNRTSMLNKVRNLNILF